MLDQETLELVGYELKLTDFFGHCSSKLTILGWFGSSRAAGSWGSREGQVGGVAFSEP